MYGVLTDAGIFFFLVPARYEVAAHGKGFRLNTIATILIFLVFGELRGYAGFTIRAMLGAIGWESRRT